MDVAGYSRLMGADEVGTVEALREHRSAGDPLIAQHGGRIVKTTGDGARRWQQRAAFETHNRRSALAAGTGLHAPHLPFGISAGIGSIGWEAVIRSPELMVRSVRCGSLRSRCAREVYARSARLEGCANAEINLVYLLILA
jgi:class 3 adenylate cyclase